MECKCQAKFKGVLFYVLEEKCCSAYFCSMSNQKKFVHVLYEDNHLLVVNKKSGILVQGDKTGDKPLLDYCKEYIKEKCHKPGAVFLHPVHRLDRPTSGVVIFARTSKALERMAKLFRETKIHKTYWAVVKKQPQEKAGRLNHWIVKDTARNVVTAFNDEVSESKKVSLDYKVMGKLNDHYLLEINPVTGRSHQIRIQLSKISSPIRGDVKYGYRKPNADASINLHAIYVQFEHPIKKEKLFIRAGLPKDKFWEQFLSLENLKKQVKYSGLKNEINVSH